MAKCQRAEGQIELKCHADKFFSAWTRDTNCVAEFSPKFTKVERHHQGSHWHSIGAVKSWHYVHDGRHEFVTTKVAEIDEKNKFVRYDYTDGHILRNHYKSFKSKIQAIPKADGKGCFVKWSFEYEKKTQDAPDADVYVDFLLGCAKDMDARLCCA